MLLHSVGAIIILSTLWTLLQKMGAVYFSHLHHIFLSLSVAPLVYLFIDDPALSSWQHSSKLVFPICLWCVLPPVQALNLLLLVTMPLQYLIPILHLIKSLALFDNMKNTTSLRHRVLLLVLLWLYATMLPSNVWCCSHWTLHFLAM